MPTSRLRAQLNLVKVCRRSNRFFVETARLLVAEAPWCVVDQLLISPKVVAKVSANRRLCVFMMSHDKTRRISKGDASDSWLPICHQAAVFISQQDGAGDGHKWSLQQFEVPFGFDLAADGSSCRLRPLADN